MNRVTEYLNSHKIRYQLLSHQHSRSTLSSAICAHIPVHKIAKAVVLEDHDGKHLMAILPGDYKLSIGKLNDELNRSFKLVKEDKIYRMFSDCSSGAIPPVPSVYHMEAIVDEQLCSEPEVFIEAGDHETLIQLDKDDFRRLVADYRLCRFSRKVLH